MALSKRTINKHNIKRAEVFKLYGLNTLDIQYAHPHFSGYGDGTCILCGQKHLRWLFSIKFDRPQGLVALAKVAAGIDREDEVKLTPVGSKCITDWLDAVPETPEKLEALKRWKYELDKCNAAKRKKAIENKLVKLGYDPAEQQTVYARYEAIPREAFYKMDWRDRTRLFNLARRTRYARLTNPSQVQEVHDLLGVAEAKQKELEAAPEAAPAPTAPAPQQPTLSIADADLIQRGRVAWANKDALPVYQQIAFKDIGRKVQEGGGFVSKPQKRYYTDMLRKLKRGN